ncbi:hypothetical protein [Chitinophaga deserti]|uniref:hypothetical protein n=1 Tax=Chitinophaga deserti TaxID=2164099 RepID=UPI000D6C2AB8|nr:hypothetical protein [Chitinophaga deserti]
MKTILWYTLKLWLIAALPPFVFVSYYLIAMTDGRASDAMANCKYIPLYPIPAALFAGFCALRLYSTSISIYQRKAMILLCAVMGLVPLSVVMHNNSQVFFTLLLYYFSMTAAVLLIKVPSSPRFLPRQSLRGRHVTLKPDNELNAWRGIIVSGLHTLPIRLKLDRNAPYPQLECHSLERDDIFRKIAAYVPVRVRAYLPGEEKPLFSGVLEIDHSLN